MSNTARFESFYYVPKSYHINGTEVIRVNPNNPKEYINSARMYWDRFLFLIMLVMFLPEYLFFI